MSAPITPGSIVVLDFGGQYAHLLANRVRRLGAFSEIRVPETPAQDLQGAAGIILSGGPQSVYEAGSPQADPAIFTLGVPVLGLCYGHQWMAQALGGKVGSAAIKEYGSTSLHLDSATGVLQDLPRHLHVWMSHGDEVTALPPGFQITAHTGGCAIACMADHSRKFYGIQHHIEVTHSERGLDILKNFVSLCQPAPWSMGSFRERVAAQIKAEVGDRKVFMLVSGGVDSSVAFVLLNQVLGTDRVQGLLVDTGLMRQDEVANLRTAFAALGITNLHIEDASQEFYRLLDGQADPERKRKIIGDTFLAVQKRVSERMQLRIEDGWLLGQGTIYPDTIESKGTKHADHIKTHHNRVEAIAQMIQQGLVVEPLKDLYKDEVRELGEELGLPHGFVWRHPFPGPGLGVRILCTTPEQMAKAQAGVTVFAEETVLPIQSVGVQGDGRTYRHALVLFADQPSVIQNEHIQMATDIPNRDRRFNRVLLCASQSTRQKFVASPMCITKERADLLRQADAIVYEVMTSAGLYEKIWQFPVVLLPCGTSAGGQSVVLRPISSVDAMTANAFVLPPPVLQQMSERIMQLPGIQAVFFDLTSKPPGTIEWE